MKACLLWAASRRGAVVVPGPTGIVGRCATTLLPFRNSTPTENLISFSPRFEIENATGFPFGSPRLLRADVHSPRRFDHAHPVPVQHVFQVGRVDDSQLSLGEIGPRRKANSCFFVRQIAVRLVEQEVHAGGNKVPVDGLIELWRVLCGVQSSQFSKYAGAHLARLASGWSTRSEDLSILRSVPSLTDSAKNLSKAPY